MTELEGVCPKCGCHYYGWALNIERNQMCDKCGCGLEIRKDGFTVRTGFSPFNAAEYKVNLNSQPKVESTEEHG